MLYENYGAYRTVTGTVNGQIFSDAAYTLGLLNSSSQNTNVDIAKYITLVHAFGVELFVEALTSDFSDGNTNERLYTHFSHVLGLNMQYYFETVVGLYLTDTIKTEIKELNYEMYMPVASAYQIGSVVNSTEVYTSQVYGAVESDYLNINNSITVANGTSFTIDSVSTTKGTLSMSNGEYIYVCDAEGIDEFTVDVSVFHDELGYSYSATLILGIAKQNVNTMSTTATMLLYSSTNEIDVDNYDLNDLSLAASYSLTSLTTACNVSDEKYGVFIIYAELYLPETKDYTFTVCGAGDMRVYFGTTYGDLELGISYNQQGSDSSFSATDTTRQHTVSVTANQRVTVKIEITGATLTSQVNKRMIFSLGYVTGNSVTAVSANYVYGQYSDSNEVIDEYYTPYNTESLFTKEATVSSYTTVDEDLNIIYQTGVLDDKFLTTPNSDKQSMDAGSIVIYKYDSVVIANFAAITSSPNMNGVVSFFEIHISNNGVDWTEAFSGLNPYDVYNRLALNDCFSFQYVKLTFHSQYSGTYIDICNFEFQLRVDEAQVIDCPSIDFYYSGFVELVESTNNLNNDFLEFDGYIKLSFTGYGFVLFSNTSKEYGVIEIKVDGNTYIVDLSSRNNEYAKQVFAIAGLQYDTYDVEIRVISGIGNIDYIAVE